MTGALRRSFTSLALPDYRRYFVGQVISITGNWMQTVAETWLVIELTGNGLSVGLAVACQFLPFLVVGAYGGAIADRVDKRRLLMVTQPAMALPPLALFFVATSGSGKAWMVFALIFLRGLINAVDAPTRQALVPELVGPDKIVNAVSLTNLVVHTSRITGPMLAGAIIALFGVAPCFAANSATFVFMFLVLRGMDASRPRADARSEPGERGVGSALREVRGRPELRIPMGMGLMIGLLAYNFQVSLPLLARFTWHGTATTYALMSTAMAIGSIVGSIISGTRGRVSPVILVTAATLFGVTLIGAAAAPTLEWQLLALVPVGLTCVTITAGLNSSLQLACAGPFRGRVMALYLMVFVGSTPFGSVICGWLAEAAGPRWPLVMGAGAAFVTALWGRRAYGQAGLWEGSVAASLRRALQRTVPVLRSRT